MSLVRPLEAYTWIDSSIPVTMDTFDADEWVQEVEQMTLMMRRAEGFPLWVELRRELRAQRVDPGTAVLVECYDEGGEEVGVVVAPRPLVLVYHRTRDGTWTWADITDGWRMSEFADQTQVGLSMLEV